MGRLPKGASPRSTTTISPGGSAARPTAGSRGCHKTIGHRDPRGRTPGSRPAIANEVGSYAGDLDRHGTRRRGAGANGAAGLNCRYALLRALLAASAPASRPTWPPSLRPAGVDPGGGAHLGGAQLRRGLPLCLIADAVSDAQGTRREQVLSRALATGARSSPRPDLATRRLAATAAPHEQAALLDGIAGEIDKGGQLAGLRAIIPVYRRVLPRSRMSTRYEHDEQRAEALAAVAGALPPEQQQDAYAEVLAAACDELHRPPTPHSSEAPGRRLLQQLAATLPVTLLSRLLDLADEANLTGDDLEWVQSAVGCRVAETDSAAAIRIAHKLSTGPRDEVLIAAAKGHVVAGRIAEAIEAATTIRYETDLSQALLAISRTWRT